MTFVLGFENRPEIIGGRSVCASRFERRSSLPVSAACVVANGVRETLGMLVGKAVRVRLMEPVCPDPLAWAAITSGARVYDVRGVLSDAAFILRCADALTLARAVFDEGNPGEQTLSSIEEEVLQRLLRSLAATLTPVCGNARELGGARNGAPTFLTFFEVLIEQPVCVRLGVAIAREAAPARGPTVRPEELLDATLEASAEFASATIDAAALLALRPGTTLGLQTAIDAPARLKIDAETIAVGQCGSRGERRAFLVEKRTSG